VTFDVASLVECYDVTPEEFAGLHPYEKLVEARLRISTLISGNNVAELAELFYRVDSPRRTLRVVDYCPKTTLKSEYASPIGMEEKNEQSSSLGLNAAGAYGPLTNTNAELTSGDKQAHSRRWELLPPLEAVAASGTVDRENGVYFKLRPTSQNTVEGAQDFLIVLRVPAAWRADYLTVRCQALGRPRRSPFSTTETPVAGQGNFVVALYLAGDPIGQEAARAFSRAEAGLRRSAAAYHEAVERRAISNPVHELAVQLSVKQPRIPTTWLEQILVEPDRNTVEFFGYLPSPVRDSAKDYFMARRQLLAINAATARLPKVTAER
jgi:hypothetical protein